MLSVNSAEFAGFHAILTHPWLLGSGWAEATQGPDATVHVTIVTAWNIENVIDD